MPATCRVVVEERDKPRRRRGNDPPRAVVDERGRPRCRRVNETVANGNVEALETESPVTAVLPAPAPIEKLGAKRCIHTDNSVTSSSAYCSIGDGL